MNYSYDHSFSDEKAATFRKAFAAPDLIKAYSIEVENGFGNPPLKDQIKFFDATISEKEGAEVDELKDRIAHYCIKGKTVTIYLEGEKIGSFMANSVDDSWDAFEVLVEHPIALNLLMNSAHWYIMGKFTPPLKDGAEPAAAKGRATRK